MLTTEKKQGGGIGGKSVARIKGILRSHVFLGILMVLILYVVMLLLVLKIPFLPREYQYQIGDKSVKTYYAPKDLSYADTVLMDRARDNAAAAVTDKYKVDDIVIQESYDQLGRFFKEAYESRRALEEERVTRYDEFGEPIRSREGVILKGAVTRLEVIFNSFHGAPIYSGPDLSNWLTMPSGDYRILKLLLEATLREKLFNEPISANEIFEKRAMFRQAVSEEQDLTFEQVELLTALGAPLIRENARYDNTATQQAKDAAKRYVLPIYENIKKGEEYLKAGERIAQKHFDIWNALGIITETGEPRRSRVASVMAAFLLAMVFLVMLLYLHRYDWGVATSLKSFGMFLLLNLLTGVSGLVIGLLLFRSSGESIHVIAVAVILNALLMSQYFSGNLGMFNSILWAGLFAAFFSPAIFFPAALLSALTCLIVRRDPPSKLLLLMVPLNGLVTYFALAALDLFAGGEGVEAFKKENLLIGFIVGVVPVATVFFLKTLIDLTFNVPTVSRLNEFANLNHPLLRKLQIEAPGTYHHSIMVGSIAELAGSAIGANPLLLRVGALYHDIGKGQRSEFFAENQHKGSNIHEKYSPSLSKIIIENHIKDGMRMARRARLPAEVIDMIPQHHGTTLITYFFRKALAMSDGKPVNEHDFRYPGPKPQSPEPAVLLMTDVAESSTRALEDPTPHRIETTVNRLFEERLLDGQFSECGLTMDQLIKMKDSIISSLVAAYHHRVAYPEEDEMKREMEKDTREENGEV